MIELRGQGLDGDALEVLHGGWDVLPFALRETLGYERDNLIERFVVAAYRRRDLQV